VAGEALHLRVQLGIEPIGFLDRGLEIVEYHLLRRAAKGPEGVLQAQQEVVGGLVVDGLAVGLA